MKTFMSLTLLFLIPIIFLPVSPCLIIVPMDVALVNQTCRQTPDYKLCENLLRNDPRSFNVKEAKGLASIMVDIIHVKASQSVNKINELLKSQGDDQQASLNSCVDNYSGIINEDLPDASEALGNDDNMTVEDRLKDITFEVDLCDEKFSGTSNPLKDVNKATHDAATIGATIAARLP